LNATGNALNTTTSDGFYVAPVRNNITNRVLSALYYDTSAKEVVQDAAVASVTNEPTGFVSRDETNIAFNTTSRVFTISPVATSFTVWVSGTKYIKTVAETTTVGATSGLYYIYYDSNGVLQNKTTFFTFSAESPTSYIYYNATTPAESMMFDERHGITMDWATHEYLHRTRGAAIASGFGIANYTLGVSSTFTIEPGTFFDEDLRVDITDSNATPNGIWSMPLSPVQLPVIYLSGTIWRKTFNATATLPYLLGVGGRLQYNSITAGTGTLVEIAANRFAIQWIAATNMSTTPVVSIMGQGEYVNLAKAQEQLWSDLDLTNLPFVEMRPLYQVIYNTNDQIVYVTDIRSSIINTVAAQPALLAGIPVFQSQGLQQAAGAAVTNTVRVAAISGAINTNVGDRIFICYGISASTGATTTAALFNSSIYRNISPAGFDTTITTGGTIINVANNTTTALTTAANGISNITFPLTNGSNNSVKRCTLTGTFIDTITAANTYYYHAVIIGSIATTINTGPNSSYIHVFKLTN